jgi:hypothetical protein
MRIRPIGIELKVGDHRIARATGNGRLTGLEMSPGEEHHPLVGVVGRALLADTGETPGRRLALAIGNGHQRGGKPAQGEHLLTTTIAFDLHLAPAISTRKIRDGPGHLVIVTSVDEPEIVKSHAERGLG